MDIIAITDHNMVENGIYAHEYAKKTGTIVLFGMELQTQEEIHILTIFDGYDTASKFQKIIYNLLPGIENDPSYFGDQVVVDCDDNIVRFEKRLLLNSVQLPINDAVSLAKKMGALVISSHVDSPNFSIISQLGYVPEDLPLDALEIRSKANIPNIMPFVMNKNIPFVTFSDAHYIEDIGKRFMPLFLDESNVRGIANALKKHNSTELTYDG